MVGEVVLNNIMLIDTEYFKKYREKLGFANQQSVKYFFAGKDIVPTIDFDYILLFNKRLASIVEKINTLSPDSIKNKSIRSLRQKTRTGLLFLDEGVCNFKLFSKSFVSRF